MQKLTPRRETDCYWVVALLGCCVIELLRKNRDFNNLESGNLE